ncbi:MAG: (d)CMP kinase, partial [Lachnospiraceae bacterium]|nr:(d)CMP kinase [Lachnospiraceae bacterium]
YVDTGAMYRAMALAVLRRGIPAAEEQAVAEAVEHMEVSIAYEGGEQQILLNQENVTGLIRTEEVGNTASLTSAYPAVRAKLLRLQQELAKKADVIMDGRDIGTCVLPDAPLKIYLTASVETRGKRRFDELTARGEACDLTAICRDIQERDRRDMSRETAPLKKAEDAVLVDSSDMTIEEVTAAIVSCARERQRP